MQMDWTDYVTPQASENTKKLIKFILAWKEKGEMMFPEDVINFIIESELITYYEATELINNTSKKELDYRLPFNYLSQGR